MITVARAADLMRQAIEPDATSPRPTNGMNDRSKGQDKMIRTLPGWGADLLTGAYHPASSPNQQPRAASGPATVRRLQLGDLGWALSRGIQDFGASRTDVVFLCVIYPLLGLLMARLASGHGMLPLVFPMA